MKLPLDLDSLLVDSFETQQPSMQAGTDPVAGDGKSRYCTWYETCQTCYTDCPCA